jgi:hypothetical protein
MTGLPRLPEPPFRRAVPTTPADRAGAHVDYFPAHAAFPTYPGGSASALSLSRPAQALLALRPAESLSRPQATFVTRLRPFRLPGRAARQLPDQSTTFPMESSSTDGSRLRGAQGRTDLSRTCPHGRVRSICDIGCQFCCDAQRGIFYNDVVGFDPRTKGSPCGAAISSRCSAVPRQGNQRGPYAPV